MKDEEIIALAIDTCRKLNPSSVSPLNSQGDYLTMTPEEVIAFARAIADLQKEKDAKLCESLSLNSGTPRYRAFCEDAIRSPETDLDEAQRRQ